MCIHGRLGFLIHKISSNSWKDNITNDTDNNDRHVLVIVLLKTIPAREKYAKTT